MASPGLVRRIVLAATVAILCSNAARAQGSLDVTIRGTVRDSVTGEGLENVNVFLSGSTYGTASVREGRYLFKVQQPGAFQLVFSRVGYSVQAVDLRIRRSDTLTVDMRLSPRVIAFNEVEVSAEEANRWHENYLEFVRAFIGPGPFSAGCEIRNPDVLEFSRDQSGTLLRAGAREPIRLSNRALGYDLSVSLVEFEWNMQEDYGYFLVYPSFTPVVSGLSDSANLWMRNRLKAFDGSLRHFLRSVIRAELEARGYVIHKGDLPLLRIGQGKFVFPEEIYVEPVEASAARRWFRDGWLRVDRQGPDQGEESYLLIGKDGAVIDPSGNLEDPRSVMLLGRWSKERMADMLPLDFRGAEDRPGELRAK
jgi:hypothetical protein